MPTMAMTATVLPAASPVVNMLTKDARPKVGFSFDHLADNPKVTRLYVSEEMLSVARAQLMKPDLARTDKCDFEISQGQRRQYYDCRIRPLG